jgi:uncharacterized membrane protein
MKKSSIAVGAFAAFSMMGSALAADAVNFAKVQSEVISPRCTGCHSGANAAGGIAFDSFAAVKAKFADIKKAVIDDKTMPQDAPLTAAEFTTFKAWIDQGGNQ